MLKRAMLILSVLHLLVFQNRHDNWTWNMFKNKELTQKIKKVIGPKNVIILILSSMFNQLWVELSLFMILNSLWMQGAPESWSKYITIGTKYFFLICQLEQQSKSLRILVLDDYLNKGLKQVLNQACHHNKESSRCLGLESNWCFLF